MVNFYYFISKSRKFFLLLILGCIGMAPVQAQLGTNLIVNGDAETVPVSGGAWIAGGTNMGQQAGFLHQGLWYLPDTASYPSPLPGGGMRGAHSGSFFFSAGTQNHSGEPAATLVQSINVSSIIGTSNITFSFGGFVSTDGGDVATVGSDIVEITLRYKDAGGVAKYTWDTAWVAENINDYAWHNLTNSHDVVPSDGVETIEITLSAEQANTFEQNINGGIEVYYDDLSLVANVTVLPITLLNFTAAQRADHTVGLQWQTGQEQNSHYIDVQRSGDGQGFASIGQVPAAGTSQLVKSYSFADASPLPGNNFYRLKLVDLDGAFKYSKVLEIRPAISGKTIEVFSNPFHDQIGMRIAAAVPDRLVLSLMDATGRTCLRQSVNTQSGNNFINLYPSAGMASGVYFLHIQGSHTDQTIRVLKQ
jgi:hypothetical protein